MDEAIVSRARIELKGYNAALRGDPSDAHNMNPWSATVPEWNRGYAKGASELPTTQYVAQAPERVDARQAAV
ncbi:hypothetical protein CR152_27775 [Massilia violaceinigra]|uniref:Uncharacterized protein n=1 Tax=Massilia violaceinigra TaxID=2045208 RepID=A0A2D2DSD3_9BURK|nr:hypothetical protein [Massilia violaceinigra]ATQ77877.1 hypothetical protein CR152_27775 [Massilia violaceinigra]